MATTGEQIKHYPAIVLLFIENGVKQAQILATNTSEKLGGERIVRDVIKCVWLWEVWDCSC